MLNNRTLRPASGVRRPARNETPDDSISKQKSYRVNRSLVTLCFNTGSPRKFTPFWLSSPFSSKFIVNIGLCMGFLWYKSFLASNLANFIPDNIYTAQGSVGWLWWLRMVTCGEIKVLRESVTRMLFFSVNFVFKSLLSAFIKKKFKNAPLAL